MPIEKQVKTQRKPLAGWESLGYAIIEQAVVDIQSLSDIGLIKNGKAVNTWPDKKLHFGYRMPHEVKELLLWFKNDSLDELLDMLGSDVSPDIIRERLGIA